VRGGRSVALGIVVPDPGRQTGETAEGIVAGGDVDLAAEGLVAGQGIESLVIAGVGQDAGPITLPAQHAGRAVRVFDHRPVPGGVGHEEVPALSVQPQMAQVFDDLVDRGEVVQLVLQPLLAGDAGTAVVGRVVGDEGGLVDDQAGLVHAARDEALAVGGDGHRAEAGGPGVGRAQRGLGPPAAPGQDRPGDAAGVDEDPGREGIPVQVLAADHLVAGREHEGGAGRGGAGGAEDRGGNGQRHQGSAQRGDRRATDPYAVIVCQRRLLRSMER